MRYEKPTRLFLSNVESRELIDSFCILSETIPNRGEAFERKCAILTLVKTVSYEQFLAAEQILHLHLYMQQSASLHATKNTFISSGCIRSHSWSAHFVQKHKIWSFNNLNFQDQACLSFDNVLQELKEKKYLVCI